jgi:hypothetical protein
MPELNPQLATVSERAAIGLSFPSGEEVGAPVDAPIGMGESAMIAAKKFMTLGSATEQAAFRIGAATNGIGTERDYNFNPFEVARSIPDFEQRYPWMADEFQSGKVWDIPNEGAFWFYVGKKELDWKERERFSQLGLLAQIAATAPSQVLEAAAGGLALKAIGAGGTVVKAGQWAKAGSLPAQFGKAALLGAGANTAQELALIGINPDRAVDSNAMELAMAAGTGGVFGAAIPAVLRGANGLGRYLGAGRIKAAKTQMIATVQDMLNTEGKAADDLVAQNATDIKDLMAGQHELGSKYSITALDTPQTAPLVQQAKDLFGDDLVVLRHPQQNLVDFVDDLRRVQDSVDAIKPAHLSGFSALFKPYRAMLTKLSAQDNLRSSPSMVARKATRLFADDALMTVDSLDRPLTNTVNPSAESLLRIAQHDRDITRGAMTEAFFSGIAEGPFQYTTARGEVLNIAGKSDHTKFRRAVTDYNRRRELASMRGQQAPQAHQSIQQAADALHNYFRQSGQELVGVRLLNTLDDKDIYTPRRWLPDRIRGNRQRFEAMLLEQSRRNRETDYYTGKAVVPDERPLLVDIIERLRDSDKATVKAALAAEQDADKLTEGWLRKIIGDQGMKVYLDEADGFLQRQTKGRTDAILRIEDQDGIELPLSRNIPLKERTMEIDDDVFAEFLEDDADNILGAYHRNTAGKWAIRKAIQNNYDEWAELVKHHTGKDLAESGYDHGLVLESIERDYTTWMAAAEKTGNTKLKDALEGSRDRVMRTMKATTAALLGRPVHSSAANAGWKLFAERAILRATFMASLGKVTVSQIADLAGLTVFKHLNRKQHLTMTRMLDGVKNFTSKAPRRHLEAFYVATSDLLHNTRVESLFELGDMAVTPQFGYGRSGRAMQKADAAGAFLADKFTTYTGMKAWNLNLKSHVAHLMIQDLTYGAKKFSRAAEFMDSGLSEADSIAKAGMTATEAARYNRLGMTAKRAQALMEKLEEHGVDWEGNQPWKQGGTFDDHIDQHAVFPNFSDWHKSAPDLARWFISAVDGETMNIIVEPKMLSQTLGMLEGRTLSKFFFQFQSFSMAWGNQFAPMVAERPAMQQAKYMFTAVGLGALSDAIHNELSGRRSIADTAQLWQDEPLGMIYAGVERAGMTGWLSRPLGLLNQTPLGPAQLLKNDQVSTMYNQQGTLANLLGPSATLAENLYRSSRGLLVNGQLTAGQAHQFRKTLPFNNLWAVSLLYRLTNAMDIDNPFGPGKGIDPFLTQPEHDLMKRYKEPEP